MKDTGLLLIGGLALLGIAKGGLTLSGFTQSNTPSTTPPASKPGMTSTPPISVASVVGGNGYYYTVGTHVTWNGVDSNGFGNGDGFITDINGNVVFIRYQSSVNGSLTSMIQASQISGAIGQ